MQGTIKENADALRKEVKGLADKVNALRLDKNLMIGLEADEGEIRANIALAYRHLEDARMRLGKAIQASEGGTSVYDKK